MSKSSCLPIVHKWVAYQNLENEVQTKLVAFEEYNGFFYISGNSTTAKKLGISAFPLNDPRLCNSESEAIEALAKD